MKDFIYCVWVLNYKQMKKCGLMTITALAILFAANSCFAKKSKHIPVYRWYNVQSQQYITVAGNEFNDRELISNGWACKTFLYNRYNKAAPNSIAIYSWYNPVNNNYISVPGNEFTDEQMTKSGYENKHFQYYALIHSGKKA